MTRFRAAPIDVDFPAMEREVLARWTSERTFEASVDLRRGRPEYVFYDGPPFATGLPHYGHILTTYMKDVVPRYMTMRGCHVPRRWGWDCHGLPIEYEIEKDLGFRSRADIVAFGIAKFNETCRGAVLRYADEWRRIVTRLGRWVDFDRDYKTMDPDYIETVVWMFKALHERGLVYEGNKVVPYCTRCQTTLSNFESRQDDAFRSRQDPAVTVRFRRSGRADEYFLAWTTTPWTLPSNAALAVGPDIEYSALGKDGITVWLASAAIGSYQRELSGYEVRERRMGRELAGVRYEPMFPYFADPSDSQKERWRVLVGDFVTTEDGTGIVHVAPTYGEDDMELAVANGIEGPAPVQDDGTFEARVVDFAGLHVFDASPHIVRHLKQRGAVFRAEAYEHKYPHCWRCDSPLIYRAIKTWFVQVTKVKAQMLAANQAIRWVPEHIRDGRFGNWLENARDWAVSRNRFWGAPVPVWRCDDCGALEVIGSAEELRTKSGSGEVEWHRPVVDAYAWPCACRSGTMRRVSDVLDCWFESGAMPYAQVHYPFERKEQFAATFPADFTVEYVAQTRGWFYTMVVLAAAQFDAPPFRNVVCHGVILADDGRKMSKRLKNYPDPMAIVDEHGSDALRVALLRSAVARGSDIRFSAESARDAVRRFHIPLWNSLHFFTAYAAIDDFEPRGDFTAPTRLDRYLLSETDTLRATVEERMAAYDFPSAYKAIEEWIVLFSNWYLRLTKQRLWKVGPDEQKRTGFEVLCAVMTMVVRIIAPFMPFLAESMHAALGGLGSVHLEDWPAPRPEWRDDEAVAEMQAIRTIVRLVRSVREERRIKHRHPLRSVSISGISDAVARTYRELLQEELNVKDVVISTTLHVRREIKLDYGRVGKRLRGAAKEIQAAIDAGVATVVDGKLVAGGHELSPEDFSFRYLSAQESEGVAAEGRLIVVLDLTSDPALVAEGQMRDLNRELQTLRKRAGLAYDDRVVVSIEAPVALRHVIEEHHGWLAEQTLATAIVSTPLPAALVRDDVDVGDQTIAIAIALSSPAAV